MGRREIREAIVATCLRVSEVSDEVHDWESAPIPAEDLPLINIKSRGGSVDEDDDTMGVPDQYWNREYDIDVYADTMDDLDDTAEAVAYRMTNAEILDQMLDKLRIESEEIDVSDGAEKTRYRIRQSWIAEHRVDPSEEIAAPTLDDIDDDTGSTAILFSFTTSRAAIVRLRARNPSGDYAYSNWTPEVTTSHQCWIGGLVASTSYTIKIKILPTTGDLLDWSNFSDGISGPDYSTGTGEDPSDPYSG